jgi:hypothetical protein
MTIWEWQDAVAGELAAAGFEVTRFDGWPLVKAPATISETERLLNFQTSLRVDRAIYAEGMIFTPAGAMKGAQE